jgi:hypothetical protein
MVMDRDRTRLPDGLGCLPNGLGSNGLGSFPNGLGSVPDGLDSLPDGLGSCRGPETRSARRLAGPPGALCELRPMPYLLSVSSAWSATRR